MQKTNNRPWLSIIMPTHNGEAYLTRTLESIIIQKTNDFECIVIDDGSTDSTIAILESYKTKIPIQVIHKNSTKNWVASTNLAIEVAKGDYICFLHQDDIWLPRRLIQLKQLVKQFPIAVLFLHPSVFMDPYDNYLGTWRCPLTSYPYITKPKEIIEKLLIQNFISIPAPLFKRTAALKAGKMDESLWYTADWDFWLKIAKRGNTIYYPKPLSGFRIHSNSQTITRSSGTQDFRSQLDSVLYRHMVSWDVPKKEKMDTQKVARFSIQVNSALAGVVHNKKTDYLRLIISFLFLGPKGAYQYIKISRIWERVTARLKAQLIIIRKNKQAD